MEETTNEHPRFEAVTFSKVKIFQGLLGDIEGLINNWAANEGIEIFNVSISSMMQGTVAAVTYNVTVDVPIPEAE